jgi:hypothetical protein
MADNIAVTAGSGTTVAADDISSVFYQRVKLSLGADGTAVDAVAGAGAVGTGVQRVTLASDDPGVTNIGAVNEAAPASDTASSGLNGRLQRIAQRVTSLIALVPASLGSKAAASSFAVTASTEDIARVGAVNETPPADDTAAAGLNGRLQRIAQNLTDLIESAGSEVPAGNENIGHVGGTDYETVAASQTDQMCGPTGATGDYLSHLLVIPATTSPGAISIEDGATNIPVFTGGASSVTNLVPFTISIGAKSVAGGWEITTGANVAVIAFGDFT